MWPTGAAACELEKREKSPRRAQVGLQANEIELDKCVQSTAPSPIIALQSPVEGSIGKCLEHIVVLREHVLTQRLSK